MFHAMTSAGRFHGPWATHACMVVHGKYRMMPSRPGTSFSVGLWFYDKTSRTTYSSAPLSPVHTFGEVDKKSNSTKWIFSSRLFYNIAIAVLRTILHKQTFIFNTPGICPTSTFIHISVTSFINAWTCDKKSHWTSTPTQGRRRIRLFTARCHSILSVCLLYPSVTFRYRDHIGWNASKIISRPNSVRLLLGLTQTWVIRCNGNTPKIRVE